MYLLEVFLQTANYLWLKHGNQSVKISYIVQVVKQHTRPKILNYQFQSMHSQLLHSFLQNSPEYLIAFNKLVEEP